MAEAVIIGRHERVNYYSYEVFTTEVKCFINKELFMILMSRNLIYSFIYSWIVLFIFIVFDAFWRLCGVQRILNNNSRVISVNDFDNESINLL